MSPKKVELYEIIASRMQDESLTTGGAFGKTYEIPLSGRAARHGEREVVLSLDAAFVIFVVFLLLLGTAYFLGLQKGEQKAKEALAAVPAAVPTASLNDLTAARAEKPALPPAEISLPKRSYTLQLTESGNKEEILRLKKELQAKPIVSSNKVEVFAVACTTPQGGKRYVLTLGAFPTDTDETISAFQKFFREDKKYEFINVMPFADLDGEVLP